MKTTSFVGGVLVAASLCLNTVLGQDFADHKALYTEPNTGITFWTTYQANGTVVGDGEFSTVSLGGYAFGIALPPDALTVNSYEYIGYIEGAISSNGGWSAVLHGDNIGAAMSNHLMLVAWPNNGNILTSFRYSPAYTAPVAYTGTAKLTQMYTEINATNWKLIYRCQDCFLFNQPGQSLSNMSTTTGHWEQGWAQSQAPPVTPADPFSEITQHDNGMGEFSMVVASATQASYSKWATITATGTVITGSATATATTYSSKPVPTGVTYDYIVVGGGAAGVPIADKLSEAGKSVLLIEKGPASSGRWGGTMKPAWLDGTNLTRFDVPGLCNEIWVDSKGIQCYDTDQMAGCVLGGGTAVNAGLWWKPNPSDWDVNFPAGWKSTDMAAATTRVFNRIPGTDHPSADGKLYMQQGFDVITKGLSNLGWQSVVANNVPASKNRTYAHTPYMFMHGERGGPLQTYLVSANGRTNFHMWLTTTVTKVVRTPQGHATGVIVEPYADGGYAGTVNLTQYSGRVILAAGTFGTSKILFRSGVGPTDQLQVVSASTDGPTLINSTYWINLPVGYNLDDHVNTDTVISHPNVTYYDWYAAYDTPIAADKASYLNGRTGPLAQAAPNIGPMFWEEIKGADGIVRQLQWTARVEGSLGAPNGNTMTLSQYLGRGAVSRGRTTINQGLNMQVTTVPYLNNKDDVAAVVQGIANLQKALSTVANLTWISPAPGQAAADYVANTPVTWQSRRANHWMGSCKMGTDDGRSGGTSVVDTNTKLYGSDNIFIVDASIWPGMASTNPSALIVVAAERASEKILALAPSTSVARYGQCGGLTYSGSQACVTPYTCLWQNPYYSQCL